MDVMMNFNFPIERKKIADKSELCFFPKLYPYFACYY